MFGRLPHTLGTLGDPGRIQESCTMSTPTWDFNHQKRVGTGTGPRLESSVGVSVRSRPGRERQIGPTDRTLGRLENESERPLPEWVHPLRGRWSTQRELVDPLLLSTVSWRFSFDQGTFTLDESGSRKTTRET